IVFVLVPGGDTYVGVQGDDPQAPYYDPTQYHVHPLQAVTLEPFFISKYEVTQGQWSRLVGEQDGLLPGPEALELVGVKRRPSYFNAGNREEHDPDRLPVEQVSPIECDALLASHGLALPTEVQWEYAGRGGTHTRWHTGEDPSSLLGYENLGPDLADGHLLTAPVGSFRPNRFGLYDVAGNVSEWCRDRNGPRDGRPPRPGDGLRPPPPGRGGRVIRGANYGNVLGHARIGVSSSAIPEERNRAIGVRAVRAVLP
ncbi:MAG: formylglycine-generating enzyme family protein, partial [Planctomycetota bacterium]